MLDAFINPRGVAVVGASPSPGKLGHAVLQNIIRYGYKGEIYPINPNAGEILGLPAFPSVKNIPGAVDLAVVLVPAKAVPGVIEECGQKGITGAVVISAGFREVGREGRQLEQQLIETARHHGIRIVGPNVLGIIDTVANLNASFAAAMPRRGHIAFMSQSGALCTSILDMALGQSTGFSRFYSIGNKADLNEIDFLCAWSEDPETNVIVAYLEGITNGAEFMATARQVTRRKPVVSIKSGTTSAGSRAASSHTGTLAGSEKAYDAAFKQVGILRAGSVQELFDFTQAFDRQPLPESDAVAVVTNAGGPGIMASDAIERAGMRLASLTPEIAQTLRSALPAAASVVNPIDVLGDAPADRYELAIEAALSDANVGILLVVLTPQTATQIPQTARALGELSRKYHKPTFAAFMGDQAIRPAVEILTQYRVPNYQVPERAVVAIAAMWHRRQWLNTPVLNVEPLAVERDKVRQMLDQLRREGRATAGDAEAREILAAYGIPLPKTALAKNAEEAVAAADAMGYPVVMKIASPDILHKTDIGGVKLNLASAAEVRDAFDLIVFRAARHMPDATIWGCQVQQMVKGGKECIIGMNSDPQFGPLLMFGLGGVYVEALKDVTFRVAPIDRREAREMLTEIRAYSLLRGVRGEKPCDLEAIADTLVRVSQLVIDFPDIVELDINPLLVFPAGQGVLGLDMRLALKV
ncbi:MAG: acetate--CoA ligase family protein [Chloroflexi bacterium]|nr:acetate--CoA ligase family protein [Chloroflexota bacterium]